MAAMLSFAEVYNGLGYFNKGVVSPYIYIAEQIYIKRANLFRMEVIMLR